MKDMVLRNVFAPVAARVGAMITGALVTTLGVDPELSHQLLVAVASVGLIGLDIAAERIMRKPREGE